MDDFGKYEWIDPLKIATCLQSKEEYVVFLYSGLNTKFSTYSYIAYDVLEILKGDSFDIIKHKLSMNLSKFENMWFGYFGYGLKNELEKLVKDKDPYIKMPNLWMVKFKKILVFNHLKREIYSYGDQPYFENLVKNIEDEESDPDIANPNSCVVNSISSNMTSLEYLDKVEKIRKSIIEGDVYEANLTRKFYGQFSNDPEIFKIFQRLDYFSPAPYSAFFKFGDYSIISSSPERFLNIDDQGNISICPIKGTAPRFKDKQKDQDALYQLQNSEKEKAENLMIVDLSRNDLSKCCKVGTVKVKSLFEVDSYASVHHMSSEICGERLSDVSSIEVIKNCFPPGSMTGAPKINAMKICSEIELFERGVYSGALGYLSGDGSADLSVIIRTIIIHNKHFEFQVGGAIIYDSEPQKEFEEIISKSKGILKALGIEEEKIVKL